MDEQRPAVTLNLPGHAQVITINPDEVLIIAIGQHWDRRSAQAWVDHLERSGLRRDQVLVIFGQGLTAYKMGGGKPEVAPAAPRILDGDVLADGIDQVLRRGRLG